MLDYDIKKNKEFSKNNYQAHDKLSKELNQYIKEHQMDNLSKSKTKALGKMKLWGMKFKLGKNYRTKSFF